MEIDKLASAAIAAKTSDVQTATAAKLLRINADQEANAAKLLESAQQNAQALANAAAGVGQVVDFKV